MIGSASPVEGGYKRLELSKLAEAHPILTDPADIIRPYFFTLLYGAFNDFNED
jgi:hypothetical protein